MMSKQREDGIEIHKKIKFTYSVYGNNGKYSGGASIYLHYGDASEVVKLELNTDYSTLKAAEAAIVNSSKSWIDNKLGN